MLKLRKNKKGFTLVELIVVIAIMAVLAGTVAGVTVSQLNKQTDKTMASEAKGIADFISTKIMEEGYDFDTPTFLNNGVIDETSSIGKALKDQYGDKVTLGAASVKGKTIGVTYTSRVFTVSYTGKQGSGNGDATYTVNEEGVVKKGTTPAAPAGSGEGAPEAGEGDTN